MRDELKIARLREEVRKLKLHVRSASLQLVRAQDIVATLAASQGASMHDRQMLTAAQENYDRTKAELERVTAELATYDEE